MESLVIKEGYRRKLPLLSDVVNDVLLFEIRSQDNQTQS